ncbi:hypothetical protein [Methylobacterium sp. J-068]|uniref:hypothetical protein n=1 Tax=Methylobacterium sp. J-068 TaxID=2836649 RepID=UPI001FB9A984|nr:hypothetical protein [Methylobacterium sp. J-068]MCJ2034871.1 hypothetical protein [Methylobacterium sp. J-068]
MAEAVADRETLAQQARDAIHAISLAFAKAARHIGAAMRGTYLKLHSAIENSDLPTISDLLDKIRNSDLVASTATKFHALREKVDRLVDVAAPFMGAAAGVILGLAGFWLVGGIVGALLAVAGFLWAGYSAVSLGRRALPGTPGE